MIIQLELDRIDEELARIGERLYDLEESVHDQTHGLPEVSEGELVNLVKQRLSEMYMPQKWLANQVEYAPSALSLALRGKRRMPMDVLLRCLHEVGYRLVAVPRSLPVEEGGEDGSDKG